jgi:hypothetical protein
MPPAASSVVAAGAGRFGRSWPAVAERRLIRPGPADGIRFGIRPPCGLGTGSSRASKDRQDVVVTVNFPQSAGGSSQICASRRGADTVTCPARGMAALPPRCGRSLG